MAGAFTHMAIVAKAINSFDVKKPLGKVLRTNLNFVTLGAVSPDIPYLGQLALKGPRWADIMHYYKTNGIVNNAVNSLRTSQNKDDHWNCQLAWTLGFTAHLVADATIHPIVESIVGPYTDKSSNSNHSRCEMVQDVMIFKEFKNQELSAAEYTDLIAACYEHASIDKVSEFWTTHAKVNNPLAEDISPKDIILSYLHELDIADGGNLLAKAFRHLGLNLIYPSYNELNRDNPDLVEKYYKKIKLPSGNTGVFYKDGFEHAAKNLETVWTKIEGIVYNNEKMDEIVPYWNLDTGIDQLTGRKTYWS